jgi:hypothetical protein
MKKESIGISAAYISGINCKAFTASPLRSSDSSFSYRMLYKGNSDMSLTTTGWDSTRADFASKGKVGIKTEQQTISNDMHT